MDHSKHIDDHQSDTMNHMKSYFHSGFGDQFFFENLIIDKHVKMLSVCGIMFLLSIALEFIKYMRCVRCGCPSGKMRCPVREDGDLQEEANMNANGNLPTIGSSCYVSRFRVARLRLLQTALHTLQMTLGLALMLAAMSFNLCIIFAIILGKYLYISQRCHGRLVKIYIGRSLKYHTTLTVSGLSYTNFDNFT